MNCNAAKILLILLFYSLGTTPRAFGDHNSTTVENKENAHSLEQGLAALLNKAKQVEINGKIVSGAVTIGIWSGLASTSDRRIIGQIRDALCTGVVWDKIKGSPENTNLQHSDELVEIKIYQHNGQVSKIVLLGGEYLITKESWFIMSHQTSKRVTIELLEILVRHGLVKKDDLK